MPGQMKMGLQIRRNPPWWWRLEPGVFFLPAGWRHFRKKTNL